VAPHQYCDAGGLSTGMATYRIFQRLGETGSGPEGRKDGARPVRGPGPRAPGGGLGRGAGVRAS